MYAEAFDVVLKIDSVTEESGKELFSYLRRCRDRKLYKEVVSVADYIERMYPENSMIMAFRIFRAEALRGLSRYREAIDTYHNVINQSPNRRDRAESLIEIGNIYRYDFKDYDSARIFYDSASTHFAYSSIVIKANLEKAKLYLVEGDLDRAEMAFAGFNRERIPDDMNEYLDYQIAMIAFFRKDFEAADVLFRQLINKYPRGFYLNDALNLSLTIGEAYIEAAEVLSDYSEALLFSYRLMPDSAEARFLSVLKGAVSPLTGICYYSLARHYVKQGLDETALKTIAEMADRIANDYFYPYCLKLKGDILSGTVDGREEAAAVYRLLLSDFGNYPFTGEIRKSLQKLENSLPPG
jgi:tetratricopeptide (TPR) repeat protein